MHGVGIEAADAVFEAADDGMSSACGAVVQPPDCPAGAYRIPGAECDRAVAARGQVNEIVLDIAVAAEDRALLAGAVEFLPVVAAGEAGLEAAVPDAPAALLEIEMEQYSVRARGLRDEAGRSVAGLARLRSK